MNPLSSRGRTTLWILGAVVLVLPLSSCVRASIEEMGRSAIKEKASEGKDWFIQFTASVDTANWDLVTSRLGDLPDSFDPYAFGWDTDGNFHTDHYYRNT